MRIICLAFILIVFTGCTRDKSLGDKIFKAIENGELRYIEGYDFPILSDGNNYTTWRMAKHFKLLVSNEFVTFPEIFETQRMTIDFPPSIRKAKFLSSSHDTISLLDQEDISIKYYDSTYRDIYPTYSEFKSSTIKMHKGDVGYKIDTTNNWIRYYDEPIEQIRMTYNVETIHSDYISTLIFIKEYDGFKLAFFQSNKK